MLTYPEVLAELKVKNISPYGGIAFYDFTEWETTSLTDIFQEFFNYGQTFLERTDLGFDIDPARLYFSHEASANALARKVDDYYLIEIFAGAIKWMHDFYMSKADNFRDESIQPFIKITQLRNVTPEFFLLQLSTLYFLYHEVGHLIQRSGENGDYMEFAGKSCEGDEVKTRHMRELDADWYSASCMAMAIKQFAEIDANGVLTVDLGLAHDIASLSLAGILMHFVHQADQFEALYYEEKCHPHPTVRLAYMVNFVLDNLQENVPFELDKASILKNGMLIAEILMKDGEENIVEKYLRQLHDHAGEMEVYIQTIMGNTDNYPYLCKQILTPPKE